jgi:alkylresorcinol/alkylpyrone synthase
MRTINAIYTAADIGLELGNERMLSEFEGCVARAPLPEDERIKLREFVRFQLVGKRTRRTLLPDWTAIGGFEARAAAFEAGAERFLDALAEQVVPAAERAGITYDAVISTTATGNLMPGLSYRLARRLGGLVRRDSLMLDLANVGCTGSIKALNLARTLDASVGNILIAAVELPSTLLDTGATTLDVWQGNCTFGDGAAAMWIGTEASGDGLAIEEIRYRQRVDTGLDLIRWAYRDYYTFALADQKTFDENVRAIVTETLSEAESGWKNEPRWAIHPAGIILLMKIARKLGIPTEAIQPSTAHYRRYSNMSSASIVHILKELAEATPPGAAINLVTMGAGFNVLYGRVRRVA